MQRPRTGATFQTSGMPGTTPYAEDSPLANAFPATATVHFHSIVTVVVVDISSSFLYAGYVVVIGVHVVVVVVVRTKDAVRAIWLRLDFRLQFYSFYFINYTYLVIVFYSYLDDRRFHCRR